MRLPAIHRPIWILVDRPESANDNAWHLFQFLRKNRRDIDAYFVMSPGANNFEPRRKAHRGRIVAFRSVEWAELMGQRTVLISSQRVPQIYAHSADKQKTNLDTASPKFVYLSHGVSRGDNTESLAHNPIDLLLTATEREHRQSLDSGFGRNPKNTVLTGLARWDRLLETRDKSNVDRGSIIVAPTWRSQFVAFYSSESMETVIDLEILKSSAWLSNWREALSRLNHRLSSVGHGERLKFLVHPQLRPIVNYWHEIGMHDVGFLFYEDDDFQARLGGASLLLTDYSSIVFDAALCQVPVIYFHFESELDVSNGHTTPGWFSYANDGFGPVAKTADEVLALHAELTAQRYPVASKYRDRASGILTLGDGSASSRSIEAIENFITGARPQTASRPS